MTKPTPNTKLQREAGKAVAEQGHVLLDGPDGLAVTMTPDAATGTAHSLLGAAEDATRQQAEGAGIEPDEGEGDGGPAAE